MKIGKDLKGFIFLSPHSEARIVRKLRQLIERFRTTGLFTFISIATHASANKLHRFLLNRRHNISIHPTAVVDTKAKFGTEGSVRIRPHCRIRGYSKIVPAGGHVDIGSNSLVNMFTVLYGHGGLDIGENVLIGPQTTIVPGNHNYGKRDTPIRCQGISKQGITIEDDVWIGSGVSILDGVVLGKGSVVAAGSVVKDSFPEYSVIAGVPGEKVGTRGDETSDEAGSR